MRLSIAALCCVIMTGACLAADEPAANSRKRRQRDNQAGRRPDEAALLQGSTAYVYKSVKGTELKLHVFAPERSKPGEKQPAIVFFFGGGWTGGTPTQFAPHSRYLASRGMVAIVADYRVKSRNDSTVEQSVADAKSAVRWVRSHSSELGIDPNRIAAGGGSAGGHLAACTGTIDGGDEPGEDSKISSRPNAIVMFNPALVLPSREELQRTGDRKDLGSRFGGDPRELSPADHVRPGQPPSVIFHGKADTTVPFDTAERFMLAASKSENRCELYGYEGQGHGFFNWNRPGKEYFATTLEKADEFLASLGWLEGKPTVKEFFAKEVGAKQAG